MVCRKDLVSALDLTAVEDFCGGGLEALVYLHIALLSLLPLLILL